MPGGTVGRRIGKARIPASRNFAEIDIAFDESPVTNGMICDVEGEAVPVSLPMKSLTLLAIAASRPRSSPIVTIFSIMRRVQSQHTGGSAVEKMKLRAELSR